MRKAQGIKETMGERLRKRREALMLTQEEIAQKLGVTRSSVSQWETGLCDNIRLKTFLGLAELLQLSPHELVYGPARSNRRTTAK